MTSENEYSGSHIRFHLDTGYLRFDEYEERYYWVKVQRVTPLVTDGMRKRIVEDKKCIRCQSERNSTFDAPYCAPCLEKTLVEEKKWYDSTTRRRAEAKAAAEEAERARRAKWDNTMEKPAPKKISTWEEATAEAKRLHDAEKKKKEKAAAAKAKREAVKNSK